MDTITLPEYPSSKLGIPDCRAPIGIFDSGVGGLSVLRHIHQKLPAERLLYIADSGYAPYGCKPDAEIAGRAMRLSRYLIERQVKVLVVACNTATAIAISQLRSLYTLPVVGIEPAVKPAAELTRTGVVGILATTGTLKSDKFIRLQAQYSHDVRIIAQPCPGLVERVEKGDLYGAETHRLVKHYLDEVISHNADTLVLGCTHYPFLLPLIRQICGPDIQILDTGLPVANQVCRRLEATNLLADKGQIGELEIWSSGDIKMTEKIAARLWGSAVNVQSLDGLDQAV